MAPIIVQMYEIQTPLEAESMAESGVDHIGSVIESATDYKIRSLKETVDFVRTSGLVSSLIPLFSDVDAICRVLDYYHPAIVHLCEDVTSDNALDNAVNHQLAIKKRFPETMIMRTLPVSPPFASLQVNPLKIAETLKPVSDFFLTDTLLPPSPDSRKADQPVSGFVGITGKTCDWDTAAKLVKNAGIPVILAGGLSPDNVYEGIAGTRPFGVDSCTLTNALDPGGNPVRFKKDIEKVRRFIKEVRRAEAECFKTNY